MTKREISKGKRITSYIFIVAVFSILASGIMWTIQWMNRLLFDFNYAEWTWQDWTFYVCIFVFIGSLLLFLSPYLVETLEIWLIYRIKRIQAKTAVYQKKLEAKIEAEKEQYMKEKDIVQNI